MGQTLPTGVRNEFHHGLHPTTADARCRHMPVIETHSKRQGQGPGVMLHSACRFWLFLVLCSSFLTLESGMARKEAVHVSVRP